MNKKLLIIPFIALIAIGFLLIYKTVFIKTAFAYDNEPILLYGQVIKDIYTDKSCYKPGEKVNATVGLANPTDKAINLTLYYVIKQLDMVKAYDQINRIKILQKDESKINFEVTLPTQDYQGYLLEIWLKDGDRLLDAGTSAIDVSSSWTKFPRYGYIADYGMQSSEVSKGIISGLSKYHINGLQFYDWQYKHQNPVADTNGTVDESWNDIASRRIYAGTVRDYINAAHSTGIAAMNYNLLFGAWKDYESDGVMREWGLYKDNKHQQQDYHPLPSSWATDRIYLFNPANPDWQNYIFQKEKEVFAAFGFDGWQIDQLGSRNTLFDYDGNRIDLISGYGSFLEKAREAFPDKTLVFNAVGEYGQPVVAQKPVDFLYAEIWNTGSYSVLKMAIDYARRYGNDQKSIVLAAYMNYKKSAGFFDDNSVRLTDAVIMACGGDHLELGDTGMLSGEYFPSAKLAMDDTLKDAMRHYYDFFTAYENLLRDGAVETKNTLEISGVDVSRSPAKKSVFAISKEKGSDEIVHLINLTGVSSLGWRDDTGNMKEPVRQVDFEFKYYTDNDVKKVMLASPDFNDGRTEYPSMEKGRDDKGQYVLVTVPMLEYWDMLVFEH